MSEEKAEKVEQEVLFTLKHHIDFDCYLEFNHLMVEDMATVKQKKTTIMGLIEVIVGALFLFGSLFTGQKTSWLYPILAVILIVMGSYGLLFYRFIFPAQLKKAAKKQYAQNEYLQNDVELQFCDDTFREIAAATDNTVEWSEVQRIKYTDHLIAMILENQRCVIIPKTSIRNFEPDFLKYLERQIQRFEITAVHREKTAG
ncbi:YcxB family protein [Zongyangia hominis]|uniref:YcxB family protein n=1 Tax=Zongyangia hominis TaxID=2763677 RepID=A0A926IBT7_9FIRM|nr:YcxB family protein [Zongyangia hominis]MBC8570633.1 YcxB family protein [Zongyangia hominis]